jgi:hypothetical protein
MKFKTGIIFFLLFAFTNLFSQAITDFLFSKELSENANAVIRLSDINITISAQNAMTIQKVEMINAYC